MTEREEPAGIQTTLGFEIAEWEEGRCVLAVEVDARHLNRSGVLHGGVLATLLDQAMSQAGLWTDEPGRRRKSVTLALTTSFTGQCQGGTVRVEGRMRASGTRIYSSTGEARGEDGALLAIGEGTFRLRSGSEKTPPGAGR